MAFKSFVFLILLVKLLKSETKIKNMQEKKTKIKVFIFNFKNSLNEKKFGNFKNQKSISDIGKIKLKKNNELQKIEAKIAFIPISFTGFFCLKESLLFS